MDTRDLSFFRITTLVDSPVFTRSAGLRVADPLFSSFYMLTVGLESKTEEVWGWVMNESVRMIGIHGVGGVGKTTVLKQIYNKLTGFPPFFDHIMWVTVSRSRRLSLEKVQNGIWKRIGVFNAEWVYKSSKAKAKAIHDALSKTKFVLLLDDIGEPLDLRRVGVVKAEEEDESDQILQHRSPNLRNNFKIIFTTRDEYVCRKMGAGVIIAIKSLEWEQAWELFKKMVGEDKLIDPKLLEMAQLIARMCKGLPMLLRTVGRAIARHKSFEEWEVIIQDVVDHGIVHVPILELCFDSLDDNTRSCLLSFSLFPEDFTIHKNDLIDFWIYRQLIAHGNFEEHGGVLNLGYKTVDALVGACLLEEDEINSVKLLDLIRDFALVMYTRFGTSKRIGWVLQMRGSIRNLVKSESFFTFLINHNPLVMLESDGKNFLTVLDLSNSGVEELPQDIACLIFLEYLNLSHTWIEHLPVEIKKLVRLKCLNLEYNELLRVVPKQLISSLFNLEVLKLFRCGFSVEEVIDNMLSARLMDIEPVFSLEHLKVLSISITGLSALQQLFSNHKLLSITQSLSLEVFWGIRSLDIFVVATMKNLLTLEIHRLENLKELNGFWHPIRENSFERLREITFAKCSSLTELTWVVLVPNLTIFTVKDCDEIEEIVSTKRLAVLFNGQDLEPF